MFSVGTTGIFIHQQEHEDEEETIEFHQYDMTWRETAEKSS